MKKSLKDDLTHFFDYDLYTPTRTVYMGSVSYTEEGESGTDGAMAERVIKALHILDMDAPEGDKPITIIMNNIGGDFSHGMAIFDAIKTCKNLVTIKVYGNATSMGAIILQAAHKRVLASGVEFMFHYGTLNLGGNAKDVYKHAEASKRKDEWTEQLLLKKIRSVHPEYPLAKVKHMLSVDTIISAQQAVDLGLADEILRDDTANG